MQRFLLSGQILLVTLCALYLPSAPLQADETKTIWVAHRRVDCVGVAPQRCYLIKDSQYEDWRFWYDEIEGFDYEEGYAYEIRVLERRIEDPPADASGIQLELVEILLKVETYDGPTAKPAPPQTAAPVSLPPPAIEPEPAPPEPVETAPVESEPLEPVVVEMDPVVPAPVSPPAPASEPIAAQPTQAPTAPSPIAPPNPPAPTGELYRGHLTLGSGVEARSFKICGAEESIWVEDRTDGDLWGLYRRLSGYPNRPLFMEVSGEVSAPPASGFGAHYSQQILIHEVRNASAESAGCFAEPTKYSFQASGNEPFWDVEISRRGLTFTRMGEDRILFPYSPPTFFADQIIYRSQIRSQEPRTLVVNLVEESCSDSMADAAFSFRASVQIDDLRLDGCARQGEEQP